MRQISKVFKYDIAAQSCSQCHVKPEPWLHIAIDRTGWFNVYVWDTREVVGYGFNARLASFKGTRCRDNRQPLVSSHDKPILVNFV